ncbi:MAG: tRNA (adenosine(37)-N6)-dimethylallyltransferase MiaA [Verrucomicrobia bacterium]|nr:tRNA (adenosine(37)-N6)-dimethylallyltransferase MiaA [Verrucomicrobiota bacterium]MBU4246817.1 tRNA (adenosine(37)-N6)-dimethylallyltransferase MiaA [Verrucomicrobiota bacterium]MBU4291811.1 tRNA (adenosine(37)-N6)-dimethylallyltransferase MiaA [Verrucomicrobiota bacterium]MBU4428236.1 tRNA (adenosine(37)-N6)-dimethylallyltransferase MiaA [Verrucomicrobiota bacterium]MCG2680810.1 tRNA (adenosine(37)-N6)-dimethylallyltransferase MiaA [Kiritimatiellia bacterium]
MQSPQQQTKSTGFFLVGPTAVGKTAVAHWIAERHGFDILSADSMLVYRGMDIGTAKPTPEERRLVRYHGLDLVLFREPFSVGEYRAAALQAIRETGAAGRRLIVTGGTGLYVKCLTDGLMARPPRNDNIRAQAECLLTERGVEALQEWLRCRDPARYQSLSDPRNPRRLIRAIEAAESGETVAGTPWNAPRTGPRIPGLMLPPDTLYDLIEKRVHRMYAAGLIEEVQHLMAQGLASAPTASKAIGYAEAMVYLNGRRTRDEAFAETVLRTRRLAKRQMTWFRHQANVDWLEIDASMPVAARARKVLDYWEARGPTPIAGV